MNQCCNVPPWQRERWTLQWVVQKRTDSSHCCPQQPSHSSIIWHGRRHVWRNNHGWGDWKHCCLCGEDTFGVLPPWYCCPFKVMTTLDTQIVAASSFALSLPASKRLYMSLLSCLWAGHSRKILALWTARDWLLKPWTKTGHVGYFSDQAAKGGNGSGGSAISSPAIFCRCALLKRMSVGKGSLKCSHHSPIWRAPPHQKLALALSFSLGALW